VTAIWLTDSDREKLKLIAEPLCIKHHYVSLDLFIVDEVDVAMVCVLLRLYAFYFCFLSYFYCVLLYELYIK